MTQNPKSSGRGADFNDPLENYDPKQYNDPLERALAEDSVLNIQSTPFASVPPETPVREAVQQLAELNVACLLVEEDGKLQGVFTDRDVLYHVALEFDQVRDRPVREVMTADPVFVRETDSAGAALCVMAVSGFRHVPVLSLNETILGIVSPQRVTKFLREKLRPSLKS